MKFTVAAATGDNTYCKKESWRGTRDNTLSETSYCTQKDSESFLIMKKM